MIGRLLTSASRTEAVGGFGPPPHPVVQPVGFAARRLCHPAMSSFADRLLAPEDVVVVLREAVGLIADGLAEFQAEVLASEADGF